MSAAIDVCVCVCVCVHCGPIQTVTRIVRAHCNYLSDAAFTMWDELFCSSARGNEMRTVGIFDESTNRFAGRMCNTFDEQNKRFLYQSAARLNITLVTKPHA